MRKLLYRYCCFIVLVLVCTAADLLTKAAVFDVLGVQDEEIRAAVERGHAEQARLAELRARGLEIPDQPLRLALPPGEHRHEIVEQRLYFDAVLNPGAFGGLLGGHIVALIALSVIAVGIVGWMLLRSDLLRHQIIGGLIIAGAFGNIYDRIVFGCVRDFVEFRWPEIDVAWLNPWNTFNFADSCIVAGIIGLLLIETFFYYSLPAGAATTATPPPAADGPPPATT